MDLEVRTADRSTLHRLDGLVLCWLVIWVVADAELQRLGLQRARG